jgi:L-aspartate oxidase
MINKYLLEQGIDMTKDRIPIYPCQHYLMGGINVNTKAQTSVDGLYAVGECSHTGVHGNNRLASNSLLEALVFSNRVANDIKEKMGDVPEEFTHYEFTRSKDGEELPTGLRTEIRHIMQSTYFVIPESKEALLTGFERVKEIKGILDKETFSLTRDYIEARSLATIAYIILKEVI